MSGDFVLKLRDELMEAAANGGKPLLSLCRKEAENFSDFLTKWAREGADKDASLYANGLADWEKQAIAGYLYQKVRGRV